ncbi:hypothetical protein ROZALSC1DRAFT_19656 [Rozella allomycis CSF55]|nr:hypothetical protein ROZALSC1DRAFT_19656 [Rozella allomycis CSF55]
MRMRLSELFIELNDLKEYIDTNYSGFKKILKKFDKCTEGTLKRTFMPVVDAHFSFKDGSVVQDAMDNLVKIYSRVICHENVGDAWTELKQQLKEHVAFERSTVWKDMIELERKAKPAVVLPAFETLPANVSFWQRYKSLILLCIAIILLLILLRVEIFKDRAQRNCFALFIFVSFLWSAEVIPLFITSFFVPFLAIILNVLKNDKGETLSPLDASPIVFQSMFSQVIVLLLGGFSIAAALSKFNIAKSLAVSVLSKSGNKPSNVLLANMFVATFLSMWISNVAAPVLCFSIIQPILRTLPNNHPFSKCLIIGIAMASNVGGMASPISSPQNVFALERMSLAGSAPSWLEWFFVSIPICLICDLLIWSFLVFIFNPSKGLPEVTPIRKTDDPISKQQILITLSTILTILLWCLNPILKQYTGEMGTIAILPIIIFFGTGILHKDDFNSFPWTVVMLASGGLVLGKAVKSSGLLSTIAAAIQSQMEGLGLWMILLIFCTLILIVTSFVSHTVGAMVILPIVQEVGQSLPNPHPKLLVLGGAFMCSGAMGLPVSGFPNITAMALEDQTGKPFLNAKDFLKVGIPCSLIAFACIISLGYGLMLLIGF